MQSTIWNEKIAHSKVVAVDQIVFVAIMVTNLCWLNAFTKKKNIYLIHANSGHVNRSDAVKTNINDPESSDHHFNGIKICSVADDATEQRNLQIVRSDEHRTSSMTKPNQHLTKSGNGNNADSDQNGSRYNPLSDEEEFDEDAVLSTSSDDQHHVRLQLFWLTTSIRIYHTEMDLFSSSSSSFHLLDFKGAKRIFKPYNKQY